MAKIQIIDRANLSAHCDELATQDARLARVIEQFGYPPLWSRTPNFKTLVHIILEQQVSLASANHAMRKLSGTVKAVTPQAFLRLSNTQLKAIGFSRQKMGYSRGLAESIVSGKLKLSQHAMMSDEEVAERLCELKGIGPWTANVFLLMALGRSDIWPTGDRALAVGAFNALDLREVPSYEQLDAIAEEWQPLRSVAARLIWHHYLSMKKR